MSGNGRREAFSVLGVGAVVRRRRRSGCPVEPEPVPVTMGDRR